MVDEIRTLSSEGFAAGKVSTGFIHATPGEIKSFRSSADRIALMISMEFANRGMRRSFC